MPSTAQPAPETDEKKSRGLGSYVVWAFVAAMVYVLSYGPVLRIAKSRESRQTFQVLSYVYGPWDAAYQTPLHKPLGLYMHIWCPMLFDSHGERALHTGGP